jgi:hypothetical protein
VTAEDCCCREGKKHREKNSLLILGRTIVDQTTLYMVKNNNISMDTQQEQMIFTFRVATFRLPKNWILYIGNIGGWGANINVMDS